jgi:DNA excision repair protein ERCC-3
MVGMVGDSNCDIKPITIAMVQTTHQALRKDITSPISQMVKEAKVIICDEVQHCPSFTIWEIVRHATKGYFRFGLSATPWRSDGMDIMITAAFGPRVVDRSASELYRMGYLTNADIRFTIVPQIKWRPGFENWHTIYSEGIVKNVARNELILRDVQELYADNRRIAIFVNQINHGKTLTKMIRERLPSHEVTFVEGEVSPFIRKTIFQKVRDNEIRVMVITPLGDEGLDIPQIDGIIIADGGVSPVEKVQQIGRGLRGGSKTDWPTMRDCQVRDYLDQAPILGRHARERYELYRRIEPSWRVSIREGSRLEEATRSARGQEEW